jgi:hypothetical protein
MTSRHDADPYCSAQPLQVENSPLLGSSPLCRRRWLLARTELLADTGSPCAVILGQTDLAVLLRASAAGIQTNFGALAGAWLELHMPELGLTSAILAFGSDTVFQTVQGDSAEFSGLAGLPLLRMVEYGGDAVSFWVRKPPGVP